MIDKTGCLQGTVGVQDPLTSLQSWRIWIGACGSDANFFNTFAVAPTAPIRSAFLLRWTTVPWGLVPSGKSQTIFVSAFVFAVTSSQRFSDVTHALSIPQEGTSPRLIFPVKAQDMELAVELTSPRSYSNAFLIRARGQSVMERLV